MSRGSRNPKGQLPLITSRVAHPSPKEDPTESSKASCLTQPPKVAAKKTNTPRCELAWKAQIEAMQREAERKNEEEEEERERGKRKTVRQFIICGTSLLPITMTTVGLTEKFHHRPCRACLRIQTQANFAQPGPLQMW